MSDYRLSPDSEIAIGDTVYKLDGGFGTLAKIQETFREDVRRLFDRIDRNLRQDELATLISIASGKNRDDIGQRIVDLGIASNEYIQLTFQVMLWLGCAMAPKQDREKKRQRPGRFSRSFRQFSRRNLPLG